MNLPERAKGSRSGFRQKAANISGGLTTAATSAGAKSGFTMVEIALSLAIIGFALVAIIGVLPFGLNVQRNNRQETIINQDAAVWMGAIRNGAQGYDDLTNYVISITNTVWRYAVNNWTDVTRVNSDLYVFTRTRSTKNGTDFPFLLTNGMHIIGILSRPKIEWTTPYTNGGGNFDVNYVVANVRAMSGAAVEKFPQTNLTILDNAFSYRMVPEIGAYVPVARTLTQGTLQGVQNPFNPEVDLEVVKNPLDPDLPDVARILNTEPPFPPDTTTWTAEQRQAYWDQVRVNRRVVNVAYTNSHDLRLTFRWPLLPNGDVGRDGRQTFRLFVGGQFLQTSNRLSGVPTYPLYFFQPSTYVQAR